MSHIAISGKWTPEEREILEDALAKLPPEWLSDNPHVTEIRREKVLKNAPPSAPGHSKYEPSTGSIVVFDKGVYHDGQIDPEQFRRSVYHELAHSVLRLMPGIIPAWVKQTKGDGFVDEYAKTSPEEDFCDSFSEYFIDPHKTHQRVPKKAVFLADLARQKQEKVSMSFMNGFADELTKTANVAGSGLKAMMSKLMKSPRGQKGLIGAGALATGGAVGASKGKKSGYEAGTQDMDEGMRQAYKVGVQRGAQAMYSQIVNQMSGR